jgi:hypothetical protein
MSDPQESANERRHEQVEAVEAILESVDPALEEHAYPVNSEELSAHYGSTTAELPNETESLGSVFDRLDDQEFDSPMAVKAEMLQAVVGASPEPPNAGDGRSPPADHGGTPQEVIDDLETEAVAESTREQSSGRSVGGQETPTEASTADVASAADDVGTTAGTADGPETEAAEPGDEMTPGTTEAGEFAPQESVEDRDREGDRREPSDRASGDSGAASREGDRREDLDDRWDAADVEPGDPAEPTTEPAEEELDPEDRAADLPDARGREEAAAASERARYEGEDAEPLEGSSAEELGESQVPDAREEKSPEARAGNVDDDDDEDESADGS